MVLKNNKISEQTETIKRKKRITKTIDHTKHRIYVVAQQIYAGEKHGYIEDMVILFGKDEDMTTTYDCEGLFLRLKGFIAIKKGRGKSIHKLFHNMKEFNEYLKEIGGIRLP